MKPTLFALALLLAAPAAWAQPVSPAGTVLPGTPPAAAAPDALTHRPDSARAGQWSLHFQQTIVYQWHSDYKAPYSGDFSLAGRESAKLSLTTTFFVGRKLWRGAAAYFNPEVSGGSGLSGARGVAGFPNGETFRIGVADPLLYLARAYVRQTFALRPGTTPEADDLNQVAGPQPTHYLGLTLGKFSVADFFDQNSYSHDPRTQFLNWSLMSAGAWDYAANTRGYTVGGVLEYVTPTFAARFASTLMPTVANGPRLDYHYGTAHAETLELTRAYTVGGHPGALRLLGFRNVATMADYRAVTARAQAAGTQPDVATDRATSRTKLGLGLNAEQEISATIGLFARLSYNDGHNETWAFTEIDQSASLGAVSTGTRWRRPGDRLGAAVVLNGISPAHRAYLAAGGYGFIIGDGPGMGFVPDGGALNYAPEGIAEVYYSIGLPRYHASLSPDYQFIMNPAYNHDRRGPIHVVALRMHIEF